MKKSICLTIIFSLLCFILAGCNNKNTTTNPGPDVNTAKLTANISVENKNTTENIISNIIANNGVNEIHIGAHEADSYNETELASFSTKLGGKDTPRTNNISITTSTLNETIVKIGETFSFCNTVGKPTAEQGYKEADSFDANGNTVQTLGGRKLSSK